MAVQFYGPCFMVSVLNQEGFSWLHYSIIVLLHKLGEPGCSLIRSTDLHPVPFTPVSTAAEKVFGLEAPSAWESSQQLPVSPTAASPRQGLQGGDGTEHWASGTHTPAHNKPQSCLFTYPWLRGPFPQAFNDCFLNNCHQFHGVRGWYSPPCCSACWEAYFIMFN